jgi:hypothetical protein
MRKIGNGKITKTKFKYAIIHQWITGIQIKQNNDIIIGYQVTSNKIIIHILSLVNR